MGTVKKIMWRILLGFSLIGAFILLHTWHNYLSWKLHVLIISTCLFPAVIFLLVSLQRFWQDIRDSRKNISFQKCLLNVSIVFLGLTILAIIAYTILKLSRIGGDDDHLIRAILEWTLRLVFIGLTTYTFSYYWFHITSIFHTVAKHNLKALALHICVKFIKVFFIVLAFSSGIAVLALLAVYAYGMLYHTNFAFGDACAVVSGTAQGILSKPWPPGAGGRFFPLAAGWYNWIVNFPNLRIYAFPYYLQNFILLTGSVVLMACSLYKKNALHNSITVVRILFISIFLLAYLSLPASALVFSDIIYQEQELAILLALFLFFFIRAYQTNSFLSYIAALASIVIATYVKETIFIVPFIFGAVTFLFNFKQSSKMAKIFSILFILNALIFVMLYLKIAYVPKGNYADSGRNNGIGHWGIAKDIFVATHYLYTIPVLIAIYRLVGIIFRKFKHSVADSCLWAGLLYGFSYIVLRLPDVRYHLPALLLISFGLAYYCIEYWERVLELKVKSPAKILSHGIFIVLILSQCYLVFPLVLDTAHYIYYSNLGRRQIWLQIEQFNKLLDQQYSFLDRAVLNLDHFGTQETPAYVQEIRTLYMNHLQHKFDPTLKLRYDDFPLENTETLLQDKQILLLQDWVGLSPQAALLKVKVKALTSIYFLGSTTYYKIYATEPLPKEISRNLGLLEKSIVIDQSTVTQN